MGKSPRVMEDHWFMFFDGESPCFRHSWTGICIYKVHVEYGEDEDGYVLLRVTANRIRGHDVRRRSRGMRATPTWIRGKAGRENSLLTHWTSGCLTVLNHLTASQTHVSRV